jgi:hypothetical protein
MMRWAFAVLAVLGVLGSTPAGAVSLLVEGTASKQVTSLSVMGELELWKDRTFLTACVGSTRSVPLTVTEGADRETVSLPRSTQLCLGLDHGFNEHWRVSLMASGAPRVTSQVQVLSQPFSLVYRAQTASAGVSLGVSYDSAAFLDEVQWGVDLGVAVNGYNVSHSWITAFRTFPVPATLASLRPTAGVLVMLGDTELQLRGAYTVYTKDPLTTGAVTEEELARVGAVVARYVTRAQIFGLNLDYGAYLQTTAMRVMAIDAISGLATAPVQLELRPVVQHRFTSWLRGQVGYTFDKYVPGAGLAHVASTRWTVTFNDHLQSWVAGSAQLDMPVGVPPQVYGILTLGVEVSF